MISGDPACHATANHSASDGAAQAIRPGPRDAHRPTGAARVLTCLLSLPLSRACVSIVVLKRVLTPVRDRPVLLPLAAAAGDVARKVCFHFCLFFSTLFQVAHRSIAREHIRQKCWAEAAMCCIHSAAIVAEALSQEPDSLLKGTMITSLSLQPFSPDCSYLTGGCKLLLPVSPNVLEERFPDEAASSVGTPLFSEKGLRLSFSLMLTCRSYQDPALCHRKLQEGAVL